MLAAQLYVRPLGRPNFAQSSEQRARTELIQFIAKRFLRCDKLPARRGISTAIAPISGVAPQWRYFWGAQAASLELPPACRKQSFFAVLPSEPKTPGQQRSSVGPHPGFGTAQAHYE